MLGSCEPVDVAFSLAPLFVKGESPFFVRQNLETQAKQPRNFFVNHCDSKSPEIYRAHIYYIKSASLPPDIWADNKADSD